MYGSYYHLLTNSTESSYWFENQLTKNKIIIQITYTLEICTPEFVFMVIILYIYILFVYCIIVCSLKFLPELIKKLRKTKKKTANLLIISFKIVVWIFHI